MKDHRIDRRKMLDDLLVKMEKILEENVLVVADIQRKKYNTERSIDESADSVR